MKQDNEPNQVKKRTEYDLLGSKLTVEYIDNVIMEESGNWVYGRCREHGDKFTIQISLKDEDGEILPKESLDKTLRHELFHAICFRGQYNNSGDDEPLMEWLAICTFILNKQGLKI